MTKRFWNSQFAVEAGCYAAFGAAVLYLVCSGRYLSYVTPKLAPYLCFTAAVMAVWAVSALARVFRIQYRKHTAHCFVLAIPLLLLLLPHGTVGLGDVSDSAGLLGGGPVGAPGQSERKADATIPDVDDTAPSAGGYEGGGLGESGQTHPAADGYMGLDAYGQPLELHGYHGEQRTITVSDEEFYNWLNAFYTDLEQLEGFQVTLTGQVYKNTPFMADNEFVPARLVMACCVADLAPCGLLCTYDKVAELENASWVTVTGTLYRGQYDGMDEPRLQVTSVSPAEPIEGYIFPYL